MPHERPAMTPKTQQGEAPASAAWNKVRAEARAIAGGHGIGDLLAAVEEYAAARSALSAPSVPPVEAPSVSAAWLLAEQVLHMDLVTERGLRARELARQVLFADAAPVEGECAEALRDLAAYLGTGGYNAPAVDAKTFKDKIMWGIEQIRKEASAPVQEGREPDAALREPVEMSDEEPGVMRFARFGAELFKRHRNDGYPGDVDGGELQELAEKFGLIEQREVTEPCGDVCTCAEIGDFPSVCYFTTAEAKEARAIIAAAGGRE